MRLGIVVSHPIQYYAPLFRELATHVDLHIHYGQIASPRQQAAAGFGVRFDWDVDLLGGYSSSVLDNVASEPSVDSFMGCDVPSLATELRRRNYDGVVVFGWYQKVFLQTVIAARRLGIPVFVRGDSHLDTPRNFLKRAGKELVYPILLRAFDAVLYVGARSRAYFEHYRCPPSRLFFSPHCVDTAWFAGCAKGGARRNLRTRLGVAEETRLILFAGKLIEFKRPLDVIAAAAQLRRDCLPVEVAIAGAGPLDEAVRTAAAEANVPLHPLGFCNQSEMPAVYAAADVLALPSTGRETWGLVCNEALACGTPIVVSDQVGCAPDLTAEENVGRRHPVGDVNAMARSLAAILHCPPTPGDVEALSDRYSIAAASAGMITALANAKRVSSRGDPRPHSDRCDDVRA